MSEIETLAKGLTEAQILFPIGKFPTRFPALCSKRTKAITFAFSHDGGRIADGGRMPPTSCFGGFLSVIRRKKRSRANVKRRFKPVLVYGTIFVCFIVLVCEWSEEPISMNVNVKNDTGNIPNFALKPLAMNRFWHPLGALAT